MICNLEEIANYEPSERRELSDDEIEEVAKLAGMLLTEFHDKAPKLAAFPATAAEALELVVKPNVEIKDFIKLANNDPSIAAEVLKVANSALFSRGIPITNIRDAAFRLGLTETSSAVAVVTSRSLFDFRKKNAYGDIVPVWQHLWTHSVTSAHGSLWLAVRRKTGDSKEAFVGGLLHDIGKTGALTALSKLVSRGRIEKPPSVRVVHAVLEAVHVEIGTEMVKRWKLPPFVITSCKDHHLPNLGAEEELRGVHMIRVISGLDEMRANPSYRNHLEQEIDQSASVLGIDDEQTPELVEHLEQVAARTKDSYQ